MVTHVVFLYMLWNPCAHLVVECLTLKMKRNVRNANDTNTDPAF